LPFHIENLLTFHDLHQPLQDVKADALKESNPVIDPLVPISQDHILVSVVQVLVAAKAAPIGSVTEEHKAVSIVLLDEPYIQIDLQRIIPDESIPTVETEKEESEPPGSKPVEEASVLMTPAGLEE